MLKKILIAVVIALVLGMFGVGYFVNKIDTAIKAKEPEFRQYITMTVEEQNAYVEKNLGEFMAYIGELKGMKAGESPMQFIKQDPAASEAFTLMGRSIVASFILANEDILKDLSADVHSKLKAESDQLESRQNHFNEVMQKYIPQQK